MPIYAPFDAKPWDNDTFTSDEVEWVNHADGCGGDGEYTACGLTEESWSLGRDETGSSIRLEDQPEYINHQPSDIITCPECISTLESYAKRFKKTKKGWIQK